MNHVKEVTADPFTICLNEPICDEKVEILKNVIQAEEIKNTGRISIGIKEGEMENICLTKKDIMRENEILLEKLKKLT